MFYDSREQAGPSRVLRLLRRHQPEYVSGQRMGSTLQISRVAVWKHIRTIRELGYKIESKQGCGYRLAGDTDRLLPWEIVSGHTADRIACRAYYFEEIGSTQDYAVELARSGAPDGSVVAAERQTRGRGRLQRRWESPDGGIWMSAVLRPDLGAVQLSLVPIAAAVALAKTIRRSARIGQARLKWPNDVTIRSKKVAGIITDATVESGRVEYVVVGVGINFDIDIGGVEEALGGSSSTGRYGVTSITQHSDGASRLGLARAFFEDLEGAVSGLEAGRAASVVRDWTRMSETVGRKVSVVVDGTMVTGTASRMDPDGTLVVQAEPGRTLRVPAGDVVHLR